MKTTRKILALLMALTLCLAIAAPAFADSQYIITIDNAVKGETYTAYKIFNVTYANAADPAPSPLAPATDIPGASDPNHQYTAYAYTISDESAWWPVVTANPSPAIPATPTLGNNFTANGLKFTKTANANEWIVEATNSFEASTFAALLRDHMPNPAPAYAAQVTASDANMTGTTAHAANNYTTGAIELNVTSSGAGYYFVDTTTGSLCSLDTTEPTATIREKNSLPTQDKDVSKTANGTYGDEITANIGDVVYFEIDVTDGVGTDAALTVHDVMSAGLTLDASSFTVQTNTGAENALETVAAENYTIKIKGSDPAPADANCTFEIVFKDSFIAGLADGKVITIKYSARVNENAVIAGLGNPNTSHVTYQNQTTPETVAKVYTYAGAIYKVNGTQTSGTAQELAGATFEVTDSDGASVKLVRISAGDANSPAIYKQVTDATAGNYVTSIVTPASGAVVLIGFEDHTVLTLTETAAPIGFNLLAAPVTLTINAQSANTVDKPATTTGGATATFVATTYTTNQETGVTTVNVAGDDGTYQIHADSIDIIENLAGTELPSTGGIGTTIFIIAGSILVLGAGIILVAMSVSKRRSEEN